MTIFLKAAAAALALAVSLPALAQAAPPPPPPPHSAEGGPQMHRERIIIRRAGPMGGDMGQHHGLMGALSSLSPAGRATLHDAMKDKRPNAAEASALRAARKRALDLLTAEKLDLPALRKAQADEREAAMKQHARHQDAMLAAYQKLSLADRKAFAEGMRDREERTLDAIRKARQKLDEMEKRMRDRLDDKTSGLMDLEPISFATVG